MVYSFARVSATVGMRQDAIVDDVLTTGAHFRAASAALTARFPAIRNLRAVHRTESARRRLTTVGRRRRPNSERVRHQNDRMDMNQRNRRDTRPDAEPVGHGPRDERFHGRQAGEQLLPGS